MPTVYACIGNSDDKLTQGEWSGLCKEFRAAIHAHAQRIHGVWYSLPHEPYQNGCACFDVREEAVEYMQAHLARVGSNYRQDSISWAVAETAFITPQGIS